MSKFIFKNFEITKDTRTFRIEAEISDLNEFDIDETKKMVHSIMETITMIKSGDDKFCHPITVDGTKLICTNEDF